MKMKNLIFIDNDNKELAEEDVDYVKDNLESIAGIPSSYVNKMKIVSDFSKLEKEEVYKLIFSKDNCICSWSMYTASHYGSLFQLTNFLESAGRNRITDILYVDGSGHLSGALENSLRGATKNIFKILNAIETNFIISFDTRNKECFRVRVELKGVDKTPFKREKINLYNLLKQK